MVCILEHSDVTGRKIPKGFDSKTLLVNSTLNSWEKKSLEKGQEGTSESTTL
jgi:hypothetical protein